VRSDYKGPAEPDVLPAPTAIVVVVVGEVGPSCRSDDAAPALMPSGVGKALPRDR